MTKITLVKLPKDTRLTLFFQWADGKGDYATLPYGLLARVVKVLQDFDHQFIPVVRVDSGPTKGWYVCSKDGDLTPIT